MSTVPGVKVWIVFHIHERSTELGTVRSVRYVEMLYSEDDVPDFLESLPKDELYFVVEGRYL